jgi:hypothetical protein
MYGVANVQKFVDENLEQLGMGRALGIMKRAHAQSHNGVIGGGFSQKIFRNEKLALEFDELITRDVEHVKIGISAIRNSDRYNPRA